MRLTIKDMPKIHSPFVRKENKKGDYVVTNEITEGYEWVFEDENVMAVEKLDGTNVSILIKEGYPEIVMNRTEYIKPFDKKWTHITQGILNSINKGYLKGLKDGQHFGELIGPKVNGNRHNVDKHYWIPFEQYSLEKLVYKSFHKYPKTFENISNWFKNDLFSLYGRRLFGVGNHYVEGIVFTHPDGRMAKIRRDMFDWYRGD